MKSSGYTRASNDSNRFGVQPSNRDMNSAGTVTLRDKLYRFHYGLRRTQVRTPLRPRMIFVTLSMVTLTTIVTTPTVGTGDTTHRMTTTDGISQCVSQICVCVCIYAFFTDMSDNTSAGMRQSADMPMRESVFK